jgi:serine/threonine-protein kinase
VLRDRRQALVGVLLAAYALAEATSHGHVFRMFPTGAGWLELSGGAIAFAMVDVAMLLLARSILPVEAIGLHRILRWGSWAVVSLAVVPAVFPSLFALVFVALLVMAAGTLVAGATGTRAGNRTAVYFLLAVGALLLPGMVTVATLGGLLPAYPATEYGNHFGAVAMSCLLSLLVADAIRQGRERVAALGLESDGLNRKLASQVDELDGRAREVEALNEELRHQVAERSRELTEALSQSEASVQPPSLDVGGVFDGRYLVTRPLGRGGTGSVYEVERMRDRRQFALKVVTSELSGRAAARFAREAEIGARVRHRNIVSIVDVGIASGGTPFLVMELVHGGSMEERRARFGDQRWALPILRQIALGLAELHANHIVHRDLKPGNVLLIDQDGGAVAKICDFGLSRFGALDDSGNADAKGADIASSPHEVSPRDLTQTGALMGTPFYMPPEALYEAARRPSADLFSFGILAYEALTARPPFAVPPVLVARSLQRMPEPAPLDGVVKDVEAIILACLRVEPSERPDAAEVAQTL